MSRTVTSTVYTYAELSDDAKIKARDWLREASVSDNYFAEHVVSEFSDMLKAFGFETIGANPNCRSRGNGIYWSGFSSQGDGACFEGSWSAADVDSAAVDAFLADRPGDTELKDYADTLRGIVGDCPFASASLRQSGHYYHEQSVSIDFEPGDDDCEERDGDGLAGYRATLQAAGDTFTELCRDLMRHLYTRLEQAYEFENSDEQVAESIVANGYEFTESGERA